MKINDIREPFKVKKSVFKKTLQVLVQQVFDENNGCLSITKARRNILNSENLDI